VLLTYADVTAAAAATARERVAVIMRRCVKDVAALKSQNIPYGLHTFGRVPPAEL
jgi:cobalamin biosynthesis Mg chelatase CobN